MEVKQIYTGCLAQGAYYIESNGEVAIIDPLREVRQYVDLAESRGASIKYILETHFHADFVSGHVTLSKLTGAPIIYGPTAQTSFDATIATDGQILKLGDITIKVIHTPGHTMECVCYLLVDNDGKEHALFSGDTLFLGDVGRPDLAQKSADMTQEQLAGMLFDSLRSKIMPLPDDLIIYPGHGAGSACGKNLSKETVGTLGDQKKSNYALREDMTREEFIQEVTEGLLAPPPYFPLNVQLNKGGYQDISEVIAQGNKGMNPLAFNTAAEETSAIVLDVRAPQTFAKGHIPRSINIGIDGGFAPWVGAVIADIQQPILLVADESRIAEVITRLSRVGFDNVLGYLEGGIAAWQADSREIDQVESISADEFAKRVNASEGPVFDVRKPGEYSSEHLSVAETTPLSEINQHLSEFPSEGPFFIHCAGGYRSMIAASILKSRGLHNLVEVQGGYGAIKKTELERTDFACPTSL